MVFGLVVRSRGLGGNLMASLRSLGGGEIHEYTSLLEDTRRQALDRLVQQRDAGRRERRSSRCASTRSELSGTMSEIVAYGTAVVVEPDGVDAAATGVATPSNEHGRSALARLLVLGARPDDDRRRPGRSLSAAAGSITGLYPLVVGLGADRGRVHRTGALPLRGGRAERRAAPGPGGGEPAGTPLEPRFRPHRRASSIDPTIGSGCASGSIRRRRTAVRRGGVTLSAHPGGSWAVLSSPASPQDRRGAATSRWPPSTRQRPPDPRSRHAPGARRAREARRYPYLNRELSWLEFNARVLHEARDERNPLLERVKFLAIFAGNLDEFFQVRIAGLRQQVEAGAVARAPDGRTAGRAAGRRPRARPRARRRPLGDLRSSSAARSRPRASSIVDYADDPGAPRGAPPALPRRDLPGPDAARGRSRAPVPVHLDAEPVDRGRPARSGDRRARLRPGQGAPDPAAPARGRADHVRPDRPGHRGEPRQHLFTGMEVVEHHLFRVTRNADFAIEEDEADDLLMAIEEELRRRRFGEAVRLEVERTMPAATRHAAAARPRVSSEDDCYEVTRHARPDRRCTRIAELDRPDLKADAVDAGHAAAPHPARRGRAGRRVRRDPRRRHPRPPPVRVVRRVGRAVHHPGRRRPGRPDDQADPVPHVRRLADRPVAHPGRRARQAGRRPGRDQGPLRRGGEHHLGAQAGAGRRARRLRPGRAQDALEDRARRPPRGLRAAPLRPHRDRQLQPQDRPAVRRPRAADLPGRRSARTSRTCSTS